METAMQQYHDTWDMNVELDTCHPNLDVEKRKTKDDDENEANNVVIVEYRGKKYRVDYEREGPELKLMPRALKKIVALEDIKITVDREESQAEYLRLKADELKKSHPSYVNQMNQSDKRSGMIQRMREKLLRKNPLRKDIKGTEVVQC